MSNRRHPFVLRSIGLLVASMLVLTTSAANAQSTPSPSSIPGSSGMSKSFDVPKASKSNDFDKETFVTNATSSKPPKKVYSRKAEFLLFGGAALSFGTGIAIYLTSDGDRTKMRSMVDAVSGARPQTDEARDLEKSLQLRSTLINTTIVVGGAFCAAAITTALIRRYHEKLDEGLAFVPMPNGGAVAITGAF
jgi:hypothetical protein